MSIFTNHDHEQELYLEDIGDESSALFQIITIMNCFRISRQIKIHVLVYRQGLLFGWVIDRKNVSSISLANVHTYKTA